MIDEKLSGRTERAILHDDNAKRLERLRRRQRQPPEYLFVGVTDVDVSSWSAFFLPKGTPLAVIQKLHDATAETMNAPAVRARLDEMGIDLLAPERRSAEYLRDFVKGEIDKWAGPIKASGATAD